jgi:Family of unknown function (DUF6356)
MSWLRWRETLNLQQLFLEHPRSIGETYFEHQRCAFEIGATLIGAGLACLLHGLVPAAFRDTGSRVVSHVHRRISARQSIRQ